MLTHDFTDACRSYELTWAIREASEESRRKTKAAKAVLAAGAASLAPK